MRTHITSSHGRKHTASYEKRLKAFDKTGGRCYVRNIDTTLNHLNVHHIKPSKRGGTDDDDNLILLCNTCHSLIERAGSADILLLSRLVAKRASAVVKLQLASLFDSDDESEGSLEELEDTLNSDLGEGSR